MQRKDLYSLQKAVKSPCLLKVMSLTKSLVREEPESYMILVEHLIMALYHMRP